MKNSTQNLLIALVLLAIPFGYAAYLYPYLPASIPTHFNIKGEADDWGEKSTIFLGPSILAGVGLFTFFIISNIKSFDPKRYKSEDDILYKRFALLLVGFLSALAIIITYSSSGGDINVTKLLFPFLGLGFSALGWYMPKLNQNYFVGFRLPWTLENVDNWKETHKVAGKYWMFGGLVQAISTLLVPSMPAIIIFLSTTAIMVIIPSIFSYRMFKNGNQIK